MFLMLHLALLIFVSVCNASEFKLSHSKLLLPYNSHHPVNQTIIGTDGGCYTWTSSSSDVISVQPIIDGVPVSNTALCSDSAMVTAVWQADIRATAYVLAHNKLTNHEVKCDVIVDSIHHLVIETTTQELYLHDAPEALVARAYDAFANTFSSLEGIPFEWHIGKFQQIADSGSAGVGEGPVLRFITWTESTYSTPTHIARLESVGLQGFTQLVVGQRSGVAHVSVSLKENIYRGVVAGEVKLLVRANAQLSPARVYLMPHSTVDYHVYLMSEGSVKEVSMPSSQFTLHVNNTKLAELDDNNKRVVTALVYGETEVILIDENLKELAYHRPTSLLHIVSPSYLRLQVSPGRRWILQVGRTYEITVNVLDHNNHQLHVSSNMRVDVNWPSEELFQIVEHSVNGTWFLVRPLKKGNGRIVASMNHILHPKDGSKVVLKTAVEGFEDVEIYDPIEVVPKLVILPWSTDLSNVTVAELSTRDIAFTLRAIGGSSEYIWSVSKNLEVTVFSSSSDCISVTANGGLIPMCLGKAFVIAADIRNNHNWGFAEVEIVPVAALNFLPSPREVLVDKQDRLQLPLAMYDHLGRSMVDCAYLLRGLSIHSDKPSIVEVVGRLHKDVPSSEISSLTMHKDACLFVRLRGVSAGFTEIHAEFQGVQEKAVTHVGAYYATTFLSPKNRRSLLAWGSQVDLLVANGPLSWVLDPSGYYYSLLDSLSSESNPTSTDKLLLESKIIPLSELQQQKFISSDDIVSSAVRFTVKCPKHQEGKYTGLTRYHPMTYVLSALIGNQPTASNPYPANSSSIAKLTCSLPKQLRLIPVLRRPSQQLNIPSCPIRLDSADAEIPVVNEEDVKIEVIFLDENGNEFDRGESLEVSVSIVSADNPSSVSPLVAFHKPKVNWPQELDSRMSFYVSPSKIGQSQGKFIVNAVSALPDSRELKASLKLVWNSLASVSPSDVTLFYHPQAFRDIVVREGSGHYQVVLSAADQSKISVHSLGNQVLSHSATSVSSRAYRVKVLPNSDSETSFIKTEEITSFGFVLRDLCFSRISNKSGASLLHHEIPVNVHLVTLASLEVHVVPLLQVKHDANAVILARDSQGNLIPSDLLQSLAQWFDFRVHIRTIENARHKQKRSSCHMSANVKDSTDSLLCSDQDSPVNEEVLRIRESVAFADVKVEGVEESSKKVSCLIFRLYGHREGVVSVQVSAERGASSDANIFTNRIYSSPVTLQVYPPLQIVPQDLLLLVGSEREVNVEGGPLATATSPVNFYRRFSLDIAASQCGKKPRSSITKEVDRCSDVQLLSPYGNVSIPSNGRETSLARGNSVGGPVTLHVTLFGPPDPAQAALRILWHQQHSGAMSGVMKKDETFNIPVMYAKTAGSIRVVSITSIRIHCPTDEVLEDETVPLHLVATSAYGDLSPLSLSVPTFSGKSQTLGSLLEITWSLSGQQSASAAHDKSSTEEWLAISKHLKLGHVLYQLGVKPQKVHLWSGLRAKALYPGLVTISAAVNIRPSTNTISSIYCPIANGCEGSVSSKSSNKESSNKNRLLAQFVIRVLPKLRWNIPHYLPLGGATQQTSMEILMSPNSGMQLRTTLDTTGRIQYSLLDAGGSSIQLSSSGFLWAGEKETDNSAPAVILAASTDSQSSIHLRANQSLQLLVHVLPVSHVMFHGIPSVPSSVAQPHILSQGGPYTLHARFHDRIGRTFHVVSDKFNAISRQSRRGMLDIDVTPVIAKIRQMLSDQSTSMVPSGIHYYQWQLTVNNAIDSDTVIYFTHNIMNLNEDVFQGDFIHIPTSQLMESIAGLPISSVLHSGLRIGDAITLYIPYGGCKWSSSHQQVLQLYPVSPDTLNQVTANQQGSYIMALALANGQSTIRCQLIDNSAEAPPKMTFVLGPLVVNSAPSADDESLPQWRLRHSGSSGNKEELSAHFISLYTDRAVLFSLMMGEKANFESERKAVYGPSFWSVYRQSDRRRGKEVEEEGMSPPFMCAVKREFEFMDMTEIEDQLLNSRLFIDPMEGGTMYTCMLHWYFSEAQLPLSQENKLIRKMALSLPQKASVQITLRRSYKGSELSSLSDVSPTLSQSLQVSLVGGFQVLLPDGLSLRMGTSHQKKFTIPILVGASLVSFYDNHHLAHHHADKLTFFQVQLLDSSREVKLLDITREPAFPLQTDLSQRLAKYISSSSSSTEYWSPQNFHKLPVGSEIWTLTMSINSVQKGDHQFHLLLHIPSTGQKEKVEMNVVSSSVAHVDITTPNYSALMNLSTIAFVVLLGLIGFIWFRFNITQSREVPPFNNNGANTDMSYICQRGDGSPSAVHPFGSFDSAPTRLWSQGYSFTAANGHSSPMKRESLSPYQRGIPR